MQCLNYRSSLITAHGRLLLRQKIADLSTQYDESIRVHKDRDARSTGCCNGCTMEDDVSRQHNVLRARIDGLRRTLEVARLVPEPNSCTMLGIGNVGTFMYKMKESARTWKECRVQMQIVGLHEEDPLSTPIRISYQSPLAQAFLEMHVGASEDDIFIAGRKRLVTLTAIRLPTDARVIRAVSESPELQVAA